MLCEKCRFIEKTSTVDIYLNVVTLWRCGELGYNLYQEVQYSDMFLRQLRENPYFIHRANVYSLLPENVNPQNVPSKAVLHVRKVEKCRNFGEKLKPITEY